MFHMDDQKQSIDIRCLSNEAIAKKLLGFIEQDDTNNFDVIADAITKEIGKDIS